MRADATLYYVNDRRFSPSQGPRTGLGPTRDRGLLHAGDAGDWHPLPPTARRNTRIQSEAWSACWRSPLR